MENKKVVQLKYSIPIPKQGGGTINVFELNLSRLKAKHLKALPKGFTGKAGEVEPAELIPLIAAIADVPESSIDEMDLEDLMKFAEDLESFLEESLVIGKK